MSTLLFLVARKASRENKLKIAYYFSSIVAQLLKLSTICKSSLHGPHNYVMDRTWERSANYGARTFLLAIALNCNFGSSSVRWIHIVKLIVADCVGLFFWIRKRNTAGEFARIFETVVGVETRACAVISRSFPRSVDIAARPVQRRFTYRGKFQMLCNDRGEIKPSFPRNQKSRRLAIQFYDIPSINPPRKMMEECCFDF